MSDDIDDNIKKASKELFNEMDDNTQFDDDVNKMKFTKLCMPASVIDFLLEHYGLFDVVELNQMALYILKSFGHMEKDGWKIGVYKTIKDEKGEDTYESFGLDIHDLIAKLRIGIADAMNKNKTYNPKIHPGEEGIKDEKDNV
jgi:hypothetical protein